MKEQIIQDFSALYTAITGEPVNDSFSQAVQDVVAFAGGEEGFPQYLCSLARDLAKGQTKGPTEIPAAEQGYSWLLRELSPLLPGTELLNEINKDVFVVPALNLAVVIASGDTETYSIVAWSGAGESSTENAAVLLNAFDPTPEQIRQWAYTPGMRLVAQDEVAVLGHINNMPLLIELAGDPACPKRVYILSIADGYVAGVRRGGYDRDLLEKAEAQAAASQLPDMQAWAQDLSFLADYLNGHGPVRLETARTLTRIVLVGRHRVGLVVKEATEADWWEFTACFADDGSAIDRLYVCQASGALVWSPTALTQSDLAPHAHPAKRDDPLRSQKP